jgi:hypothetical protein
MFRREEKDINNWTGFESRVILISDIDHMNLLIDTVKDRAVKVKGSYMNVNCANWNPDKREIEFFGAAREGNLKIINSFTISNKAKYLYIREDILLEGLGHDEDGVPEEADVVGIKINVLTSLNDKAESQFKPEEWIDREEKEIFASFKYLPLALEGVEEE